MKAETTPRPIRLYLLMALILLPGLVVTGCNRAGADGKREGRAKDPMAIKQGGPLPTPADEAGAEPALSVAARAGDEAKVRELLKGGADVNARGGGQMTALMAAAGTGHGGVVQMLLDKGADANMRDGKGETAAQKAEDAGHKDLAKKLKRNEVRPPVGPAKPIPAPK